jgi:thiamine-monophosphate kinase
MQIKDIGEFSLISRIAKIVGVHDKDVIVPLGDDAAVVKLDSSRYTIFATDILIQDVHFSLQFGSPRQLGYRALAVNVSDVAAMAGLPRFAVVSLGVRDRTEVSMVEELYEGMKEAADDYGMDIVGGDTSSAAQTVINVAVIGEVEPELLRTRSEARVGDTILVTGFLGASAAGLELLLNPREGRLSEWDEELRRRHLLPVARIREARIASRLGARAMEDISDGLIAEVTHICEQSRVGARVHTGAVPVARGLEEVAQGVHKCSLDFALGGGEDYELVLTAPQELAQAIASAVESQTGTKVSIVGEITPPEEEITFLDDAGQRIDVASKGYEHFR